MNRRFSHEYNDPLPERSSRYIKGIWIPPESKCPKCGSMSVKYYDPFLFSPVRTLTDRRRIKCNRCRFIWRPSRRKKNTLLSSLFPGLK